MNNFGILNTREISVAIWSLILFFWALSMPSVRHSLVDLIKTFFALKIVFPFLFMLFYILLMVIILKQIGFWDNSAIKDTILWTTGTAFVTFFSLDKALKDDNYFKAVVSDNIKLVLILEFIINLYTFNLIVELVVIPVISIIAILRTYAEIKPEYKKVKVFLDYVLGLFGLVLLAFTFRELSLDFQNFASIKNVRDFFLPLLLTLLFLPFVYVMALYMQYDSLFTRVDFANRNPELAIYLKLKVFTTCHISLSKLNSFSKRAGLPKVNNKEDIFALIKKTKGE